MLIFACVVLAGLSHAAGNVEKVTPVEKVTELLKKLSEKTAEEGKVEAEQYDKYSCFCKEQADEKLYSITKKAERMSLLDAQVKSLTADVTSLNKDKK